MVPLVVTLGLVTKRSNEFGYTNLNHSRSHKIEKNKTKNEFGPFSYKFFVPIRVGLRQNQKKKIVEVQRWDSQKTRLSGLVAK